MKTNFKNSLFYFLIAINISNCIFAQTSKNKVKEGKVTTFSNSFKYVTNYKNGIKYGESITYLNDGSIYEKGNYFDGKKIGEWTTYDKGKVSSKYFYKKGEGNYDVIYCNAYEDTKAGSSYVAKGSYTNGKEDGYFIEVEKILKIYWFDSKRNLGGDEKKVGKGVYINGYKEGIWTYYNENDILREQISYVNGEPDGRKKSRGDYDIEYANHNDYFSNFRNGEIENISIKDSIDGKKNGQWQFNYKNGFKLIVNFIKGIKSGDWIGYNENGDIIEKCKFVNSKIDGDYIYYDNHGTTILEKGQYKNGIAYGDWLEIAENQIDSTDLELKKGKYVDGMKEGKWETLKNFSNENLPTYKIIESIYYKNGIREGEYICYYQSPNILWKGLYEKGIKQGEWFRYDGNGQIKEKLNFINGKIESGVYVLMLYEDGSRVEESINNEKKRKRTFYNDKGEIIKEEIITN